MSSAEEGQQRQLAGMKMAVSCCHCHLGVQTFQSARKERVYKHKSGGGHAIASGKRSHSVLHSQYLYAASKSRLEAKAMNMSRGRCNLASVSHGKCEDVAAWTPERLLQPCQGLGVRVL